MDGPKSVTAYFQANMTTNKPTPEWWLAKYGITNDFEEAVTNDVDEDGVPTGEEYVMNTDPTNELSYLRLIAIGLEEAGETLTWPCATDRVYDVQYDLGDPSDGWIPLEGFTDIEPDSTQLVITNALDANALKLYRIRVRLPGK